MNSSPISRRRFIGHLAVGSAMIALPKLLYSGSGTASARRIALAGNSMWGRAVVSSLCAQGAELMAICEVIKERRAMWPVHEKTGHSPAMYSSWESALNELGVNCAVIATPDHAKSGAVRAALLRGCDVIVRGPGASSIEEWLELERIAKTVGRSLIVPAVHRNDENLQALRSRIASAEFGVIRSVELDVWEPKVRIATHLNPNTTEEIAHWCGGAALWPESRNADFGKVHAHWREIIGYGQGAQSGEAWDAMDLMRWMTGIQQFEVTAAMGGTHVPLGFLPRSMRTAKDHQIALLKGADGSTVSCQFRRSAEPGIGANRCVLATEGERITLYRVDGRWQYRGGLCLAPGSVETHSKPFGTADSSLLFNDFAAIEAAS